MTEALRMARRQWVISAAAVVVLVAALSLPLAGRGSSQPYAQPRLECRRTAFAGARMTVVGREFPGRTRVLVRFDATTLTRVTTGTQGGFSARVRVPPQAGRGQHTITATAGATGAAARCAVRVRR